jgi:hypothetical protein
MDHIKLCRADTIFPQGADSEFADFPRDFSDLSFCNVHRSLHTKQDVASTNYN